MRYINPKLHKTKTQQGDTIIEVLISMVIISMVFGAAFTLANRSSKNSISSRERVEALKLVEGQIEILKTKRGDPSFNTTYQLLTPGYCFDTATGNKVSLSSPACTVRTLYKVSVYYTPVVSGSSPYYTSKVTWDSLTGPVNVTSIDYRP